MAKNSLVDAKDMNGSDIYGDAGFEFQMSDIDFDNLPEDDDGFPDFDQLPQTKHPGSFASTEFEEKPVGRQVNMESLQKTRQSITDKNNINKTRSNDSFGIQQTKRGNEEFIQIGQNNFDSMSGVDDFANMPIGGVKNDFDKDLQRDFEPIPIDQNPTPGFEAIPMNSNSDIQNDQGMQRPGKRLFGGSIFGDSIPKQNNQSNALNTMSNSNVDKPPDFSNDFITTTSVPINGTFEAPTEQPKRILPSRLLSKQNAPPTQQSDPSDIFADAPSIPSITKPPVTAPAPERSVSMPVMNSQPNPDPISLPQQIPNQSQSTQNPTIIPQDIQNQPQPTQNTTIQSQFISNQVTSPQTIPNQGIQPMANPNVQNQIPQMNQTMQSFNQPNNQTVNQPLNQTMQNQPLNQSMQNQPLNQTIQNQPLNQTMQNQTMLNQTMQNPPINQTMPQMDQVMQNQQINQTMQPINQAIPNQQIPPMAQSQYGGVYYSPQPSPQYPQQPFPQQYAPPPMQYSPQPFPKTPYYGFSSYASPQLPLEMGFATSLDRSISNFRRMFTSEFSAIVRQQPASVPSFEVDEFADRLAAEIAAIIEAPLPAADLNAPGLARRVGAAIDEHTKPVTNVLSEAEQRNAAAAEQHLAELRQLQEELDALRGVFKGATDGILRELDRERQNSAVIRDSELSRAREAEQRLRSLKLSEIGLETRQKNLDVEKESLERSMRVFEQKRREWEEESLPRMYDEAGTLRRRILDELAAVRTEINQESFDELSGVINEGLAVIKDEGEGLRNELIELERANRRMMAFTRDQALAVRKSASPRRSRKPSVLDQTQEKLSRMKRSREESLKDLSDQFR